jgi:hypothetical protein
MGNHINKEKMGKPKPAYVMFAATATRFCEREIEKGPLKIFFETPQFSTLKRFCID